jgi:lysophospholipase L1-like esterase
VIGTVDISAFDWHGPEYSKQFLEAYSFLKLLHPDIRLVPFVTYESTTQAEYFLDGTDSIHPNEKGHKAIAEKFRPVLKELLQELEQ